MTRIANCRCGAVSLEFDGDPIMTVACYCHSCQQAGKEFAELADASAVLDADDGTHFVMCRKDRVQCAQGGERLREHRLKPDSETRRAVAQCCNSPMFLEFEKGHWLSLYKDRFDSDDQPPLEMRTMTMDRRAGVTFDDDIPSPKKHSARFMWKLMTAWMAMGFRTPKIDYVGGTLYGDRIGEN